MSVSCALDLLARSLTTNLAASDETLGEVGISQSINSFEVEMSNWVSVFFTYLESQRLHIEKYVEKNDELGNNSGTADDSSLSPLNSSLIRYLIEFDGESVEGSAQRVFDILQQEVDKGVLIPRVKNHLILATTDLRVRFADHHQLLVGFMTQSEDISDYRHDREACTGELIDDQPDGAVWIINWLKRNLDENDQQALDVFGASG